MAANLLLDLPITLQIYNKYRDGDSDEMEAEVVETGTHRSERLINAAEWLP